MVKVAEPRTVNEGLESDADLCQGDSETTFSEVMRDAWVGRSSCAQAPLVAPWEEWWRTVGAIEEANVEEAH
eukprot:CAMPEP_0119331538 /NCGR_PEP_ID=MMETSP1333-20130426/80753_1 /TAXON_ID=418940 /ORGANISM="Scyphosphaera apsteinii, Strain RCC1455" /LENGTH=71 /DNA_ID=CAMNT_0007341163 /DNA_START=213 /DNA_END=428 /DNA_ORIENTATION=+